MASQTNAAPVVIKRKKVVKGGGHHGGAWKVAYADFVTAMMAFFMLMWLLNATTEKQRKGISDYFNPAVPVSRMSAGGNGAFGGDSIFSQDTLAKSGTGGADVKQTDGKQSRGVNEDDKAKEAAALAEVAEMLRGRSGDSESRELLLKHVATRVTDEGLVVEIFDRENESLFKGETAEPTQLLRDLVLMVSDAFLATTNAAAVNGHIRSYPIVRAGNPMWNLTSSRAMAVRDMMEAGDFPRERLQRVTGFADRKPAADPQSDVRNNRIEMILLRNRT